MTEPGPLSTPGALPGAVPDPLPDTFGAWSMSPPVGTGSAGETTGGPAIRPAAAGSTGASTAGSTAGATGGASRSDVRTGVDLSASKRRLVEHLKRRDSATASELALAFGLTDTALRQHLDALEALGFVERFVGRTVTGRSGSTGSSGRGRPPQHWRLTDAAGRLFPDGHGDLTVELIESVRDALGDDGLGRVVQARAERQAQSYVSRSQLAALTTEAPLATRVQALADMRSDEGYLAEAVVDGDDVLLVEHHCPIGCAARACDGICDAELVVFRRVLGDDVHVTRETHMLAGDRRCTYRVSASRESRVSASGATVDV